MKDGTCEGCFYALPTVTDDQDITMKCRRYPPVIVVLNDEPVQMRPDATDRCGEYKAENVNKIKRPPEAFRM